MTTCAAGFELAVNPIGERGSGSIPYGPSKINMQRIFKTTTFSAFLTLLGLVLLGLSACADKAQIFQQNSSISFTQDYNPPLLDILWVLDDRSQFYNAPGRANIIREAESFFKRLDGSTTSYQMGFITADMLSAQGRLQPVSSPVILKKNMGTLDQRVALFSSLLTQVAFNGRTGGVNKAFQATTLALSQSFQTRANVPLVIVFISDSDDHSTVPNQETAVSYYSRTLLAFKNNNRDLLKVYSINYEGLASGQTINTSNRCVTLYNADIDQSGFQDRFFQLALNLGGDTGGICGSFSQKISLNGLKLRQLPSRFKLDVEVQESSLRVVVTLNGSEISGINWTYDTTTNEIVFSEAPPEGSQIDVTYVAR